MTPFTREDGSQVILAESIGKGGEGEIWKIHGNRYMVAKIYHEEKRNSTYADKLQVMQSRRPRLAEQQKGGHRTLVWPEEKGRLFDARNKFVGFLMPYVNLSSSYELFKLYQPKDRRETLPAFTWQYLLRTARNLASIVAALHLSGYVVGDLNESNVFVSGGAQVTFVDCDSIQVPQGNGQFFRSPVGKGEFTPPELQGCNFSAIDRAPYHDNFALAVIIFMLLMEGRHPFTGVPQGNVSDLSVEQNIKDGSSAYTGGGTQSLTLPRLALPFDMLPPTLQGLMRRCFQDGYRSPQQRPAAGEWYHALGDVEQYLVVCRTNKQHVYGGHLSSCPWCRLMGLGMPDSFPPLKNSLPFGSGTTRILPPIQTSTPLPRVQPPPTSSSATPTQVVPASPPSSRTTTVTPIRPHRVQPARSTDASRRVILKSIAGLAAVAGATGAGISWLVFFPSPLYVYHGHHDSVRDVRWSPKGQRLASASDDGTVQVWDATSGKNNLTYHGHAHQVTGVAWSPDGKHIASAGYDKTVQVWNAATGKRAFVYRGHTAPVYTVAWAPNGRKIASGGGDNQVHVWDAATGKRSLTYHAHSSKQQTRKQPMSVFSIAWSPDSKHIASVESYENVQIWDASTGHPIHSYSTPALHVHAAAWSPDGNYLACGNDDGTVAVLNTKNWKTLFLYHGHSTVVHSLAWSHDGMRIVSASNDNTMRVWVAKNGHEIFTYRGNFASAVAWSPDNQTIASIAGSTSDKLSTLSDLFPFLGGSPANTVEVWLAPQGRN